jgi:hypothetical protein
MIAQETTPIQVTLCCRCNRVLKDSKSIKRGMGRTCTKKSGALVAVWLRGVEAIEVEAAPVSLVAIAEALSPKIVQMAAHVRRSNEIAGLVLEYDGAGYLTVKFGRWFEVFAVMGGNVVSVDCSDRGIPPTNVVNIASRVARGYAAKLAGKAVA